MVSSLKHNTYNAYIRIHIHMHIINDDRGCLPDTGLRMLCKCKNVNARIRHLKDQVLYPCYIQLLMLKCGNITGKPNLTRNHYSNLLGLCTVYNFTNKVKPINVGIRK